MNVKMAPCAKCGAITSDCATSPVGDYLCCSCAAAAVKEYEEKLKAKTEEKHAVIKAKLSVIAEMERTVERMKNDAIFELGNLGLAVEDKVELLVKSGNKARAIMAYREATGKSLRESKDFVDDMIDRIYR